MKFICSSCKAKYQIADEKVAGRAVRMKCRKCGHLIEISKAVTESSVSTKLPGSSEPPEVLNTLPPVTAPPAAPSLAPAPLAPVTGARRAPPPATRSLAGAWASHGPSATASRPLASPSPAAPATRSPLPTGARPSAPGAARPSATGRPAVSPLGSAPQRTAPLRSETAPRLGAPTATPIPAGKPRPAAAVPRVVAATPGRAGTAGARMAPAAVPSLQAQDDDEEQTQIASSSLLAGAFNQAVATAPKRTSLAPASGLSDEWHVGINGIPVGPIRLNELRSKAAAGAINKDSLVWQEGFEEWKPLSTFPELVAIVEESLSSTRAAPTPLVPPAGAAPAFAPAPLVISDPFAASVAPAPAVRTAPPGTVTGSALVTESPSDLALALKRPSSSKAAWIAVVVALLCGLTIGFVVFSNQKPIVKIVEVPAKTAAAPAAIPPPEEPTTPAAVEEVTNVGTPRKGGRGPAPGPAPEPKPTSKLTGLSGLQAGPQQGPSAGQTPVAAAGGGQPLDGTMIQSTVSRYTGSVKRRCWQPALDTRGKDAPSSARVSASITVAANGSVQNVTSSGDPQGYHGLASCITSSIRGWQFPASSGTTTVNVPFVFASQ